MADKVSLEKNKSDSVAQIQEVNAKLDFLIEEVKDLRQELNNLQSKNNEQLYKLDSQLYHVCSDLKGQIYKFQSEFYDGSRKVKDELKELQDKTRETRSPDKNLQQWAPLAIAGGGIIWAMIICAIFS